jgi:hypothetical protein
MNIGGDLGSAAAREDSPPQWKQSGGSTSCPSRMAWRALGHVDRRVWAADVEVRPRKRPETGLVLFWLTAVWARRPEPLEVMSASEPVIVKRESISAVGTASVDQLSRVFGVLEVIRLQERQEFLIRR